MSRLLLAGLALVVVAVGVIGVATLLVRSQTEWSSETGVQIAARRLDDGRVEFGLRQRVGDEWSELSLPAQRYLLEDAPIDEWLLSDELQVTGTSVNVHLREGVYAGDWQDEFVIYLDDEVYETNCSKLQLAISGATVLFRTLDEECANWIGLGTACGGAASQCDLQRARLYQWEQAQLREYGFERFQLTWSEVRDIVSAVFTDYLGNTAAPPTVKAAGVTVTPHYDPNENAIYLTDWSLDLYTVLHETIHAIHHFAFARGGHGARFVAQTLDVWESYAPIIDIVGAKAAAREHGLEVDSVVPVRARSRSGVELLHDLFCTVPVRSKFYCDALTGSMRSPSQAPDIAGEFQPVQEFGQINSHNRYYAQVRDGSLFTSLTSDARAMEDPEVVAHFRVTCARDVLRVEVWWELTQGTSSSVLVRIGDGDFKRQRWQTWQGKWNGDSVDYDSRVVSVEGEEAKKLAQDLIWAEAGGEGVTIQIRSGSNSLTATFDLEGLFDTPVQPNIARCGRDSD